MTQSIKNLKTLRNVNDEKHINKSNAPPKLRILLKMRDGFIRHAQRDGPRGRDPAFWVPVSLSNFSTLFLCAISVNTVVKKGINHGQWQRKHRGYGVIIPQGKNINFSQVLHSLCSVAGEKYLCSADKTKVTKDPRCTL
ncbi:hypothetical protein [uncultured Draconibacterium sp.]|uniref:hypothetical protein n=1 Tax=uncultured Draconibacterium sp. TaxID=1573823 RepID=UPI0032614151